MPLPVLVEVYRGAPSDATIDRVVNRTGKPLGLDRRTARLAGGLRTLAGRGSAVDAVVVATAVRLGGAIIATGDPGDLKALASRHSNVKVWSLNQPP